MTSTRLPDDVGLLSWLADQIGVSESTLYRLAARGELERFGVFRVGAQYRVSKPKALRAIHGESEPKAS
jgi:DNA-binding MurR/RpiR family transcriptional regulator